MKTRIRFTKTGTMRFIGHLDLMRFFQKALRRAQLDVAYSQGYSPHQIMSFASPLGIGLTSDGEYLDVEFHSLPDNMDKETLLAHMNQFMTDEIIVTDIEIMPDKTKTSMALLRLADYVVCFKTAKDRPDNLQERFAAFMNQDTIEVTKKTKKSEKIEDIKPMIFHYAYTKEAFSQMTGTAYLPEHRVYEDPGYEIYMQVSASSAASLKPSLIMESFLDGIGKEREPYTYQIHRMEMYFEGGKSDEESVGDSYKGE